VDITAQKLANADYEGQIAAIGKSQAVAEFEMDGTLVNANELFLKTMGYSLGEVVGKHHHHFVREETRNSAAYADFWKRLREGQFQQGEFPRVGKSGNAVWIQAT
jgi:methyl-accepting chemotaxis protein